MRQADAIPRPLHERLLRLELEDLEHGAAGDADPADLAAGRRAPAPSEVEGSTPKNLRTRSDGVSDTPTSGQPNTSQ